MAWIAPRTWVTGELVTAALMQAQISDNLSHLGGMKRLGVALSATEAAQELLVGVSARSNTVVNEGADYTTTSTNFVDVDSGGDPDLSETIITTGGDVLIGFVGSVANSAVGHFVYFDIHESVKGATLGENDGMIVQVDEVSGGAQNCSFVWLARNLSAAEHTFKLQWMVTLGTATMYAGAGTADADMHPNFWVLEV